MTVADTTSVAGDAPPRADDPHGDSPTMSLCTFLATVFAMIQDLQSGAVNPMGIKKQLAREITSQFHDPKAADAAQAHFEQVVQGQGVSDEIPEFRLPTMPPAGEGIDANEAWVLSKILVDAGSLIE